MAEVALANAAVSADQVEVIQAAANVNMILDGKMVCVVLVCPAVDAYLNTSRAIAEVVLEMNMGGAFEAGESDGGGD